MGAERPAGRGPRLFARLARFVVAHPWHFIVFWVVLLLVTVPFLQYLGGVTTSSTTTLPASAPSSIAESELARLFPNETSGTSSYLLLQAANMTDAYAQSVVMNVTHAVATDASLSYVASVSSIYTEYAAYLAGDVQIATTALQGALASTPSLPSSINLTAGLIWGVPTTFLSEWNESGANRSANYPAFQATERIYAGSSASLSVLGAFYNGTALAGGFNTTLDCANATDLLSCANRAVTENVPALFPSLFPTASSRAIAESTVSLLELQNYTAWPSIRFVVVELVGGSVGVPAAWLLSVWDEFPDSVPTPSEALAWANTTVAGATLWTEPLPIPHSLFAQYVSGRATAQLVIVSFSVGDGYTTPGGGTPVYDDVKRLNSLVPSVVAASDPARAVSIYQTGPAPLDLAEQTVVNAAIDLVLPATVAVLLIITALYFRSPTTPLVAFAGLALALVLALGGTVLLGTLVTHVDTTSITIEEVFVLGVGTDYSIFLISRYREELVAGAEHRNALVTSVTWAGQSVATSGTTAVIATLALAFSGVALLSQWGMVLSLAVLITILVSLTLVPAIVTVLGPRIFWPYTRERFRRQAERHRARAERREGYFYRVAAFTRRKPLVVLAVILVVSAPIVYEAIGVPISYDFYDQLPTSQSAVQGLNELGDQFGAGFAFPTTALVTFAAPIIQGNQTNATEFSDLAQLTLLAEGTRGVAVVQSLVGPYGAPLATWQNLSSQPVATQVNLEALAASLVGIDQRTVVLTIQTNASGLSLSAIGTLSSIESAFSGYASAHPAVVALAYAGGGPTTNDLANEAALATERLFIAVAIALLVVLFVVLRSWMIPLLAVATIGLSIAWAWGLTYLVLDRLLGIPIFFYVPTLMFILILGLGIDYNIFLLSRIREERLRGRTSPDSIAEGLARTGGIITAAAVILAGAFATLLVGDFSLLIAIGFSVAVAVILDAMIVRTFLVPSVLQLLGERVWHLPGRRRSDDRASPAAPAESTPPPSP